MSCEVQLRDALQSVHVVGNFGDFVNNLNIAVASGKQFIVMEEIGAGPVAFETRNITLVRESEEDLNAFIGR